MDDKKDKLLRYPGKRRLEDELEVPEEVDKSPEPRKISILEKMDTGINLSVLDDDDSRYDSVNMEESDAYNVRINSSMNNDDTKEGEQD